MLEQNAWPKRFKKSKQFITDIQDIEGLYYNIRLDSSWSASSIESVVPLASSTFDAFARSSGFADAHFPPFDETLSNPRIGLDLH